MAEFSWSVQSDNYCERVDLTFWAEPINAVTNAAFLIAAMLVWRHTRGLPLARALAVILFLIGLGSFAFHATATRWGAMADVMPILAFILVYIFAATRDFFGIAGWKTGFVTLLFLPFAALTAEPFARMGMGSSAAYAPVPLLIFIYAILLRNRTPETARGLAIGAAILCLSIASRMADDPLCHSFPMGTHFLWHILNATMLGHMIMVYVRHRRAAPVTKPLEGRAPSR